MNDLISRKAAIDALGAICDRECVYSKAQRSTMCDACRLESAFDVIEELPSAQPEQKKGKWVRWYEEIERDTCKEFIPHCKCSECGTDINTRTTLFIKFCPYCGADMRGDKHEAD